MIQNHSIPKWERGRVTQLAARPQRRVHPESRLVDLLSVVSRAGGSAIHLLQFTAYYPNMHGIDEPVIAVTGGVYNWQQNANTLQQEKATMADVTAMGNAFKAMATVQTDRSLHAGIHLSYPGGQRISHVLVRVWHAGLANTDDYQLQMAAVWMYTRLLVMEPTKGCMDGK